MTKQEQEKYKDLKPVAVFPINSYDGVEILTIEYGIEDYVIVRYNQGNIHRKRIYTSTKNRNYFNIYDMRIYLDECLKVD